MPKFQANQIDPFTIVGDDLGFNGKQVEVFRVDRQTATVEIAKNGTFGLKLGKNIAITAAGVATSGGLTMGAPFTVVITGSNGAGACTATGLKVGDKVVSVTNLTTPADAASSFEGTVTVADQIQQSSASNLSASKFLVLVVR